MSNNGRVYLNTTTSSTCNLIDEDGEELPTPIPLGRTPKPDVEDNLEMSQMKIDGSGSHDPQRRQQNGIGSTSLNGVHEMKEFGHQRHQQNGTANGTVNTDKESSNGLETTTQKQKEKDFSTPQISRQSPGGRSVDTVDHAGHQGKSKDGRHQTASPGRHALSGLTSTLMDVDQDDRLDAGEELQIKTDKNLTLKERQNRYQRYKNAERMFQEAIVAEDASCIEKAYKKWNKVASGTLSAWHPMIHAACINSYPICKQLHDLGLVISTETQYFPPPREDDDSPSSEMSLSYPEPHKNFCGCEINCQDSLKHELYRVNAYRAMCAPCYLLTLDDPISEAFRLRKELELIARSEKEFRQYYSHESDRCEEFICDMICLVGARDELETVLSKGQIEDPFTIFVSLREPRDYSNDLPRIQQAIEDEAKKFIALPYIQRHLTEVYYSARGGESKQQSKYLATSSNILKFLMMIFGLPIMSIMYILYVFLFWLENKVSWLHRIFSFLRIPAIKFYSHAMSYIVFLALVSLSTVDLLSGSHKNMKYRERHFNGTYMLILIYVLSFMREEVRQITLLGVGRYLSRFFNWLDMVMISCYLASFSCRYLATIYAAEAHWCIENHPEKHLPDYLKPFVYNDRVKWDPWDPEIIADGLFGIANVISFTRLSFVLPAFEALGPLLVIIGRMLRDILRFMSLLLIVFTAFAIGIYNLYKAYGGTEVTVEKDGEKEVEASNVAFGSMNYTVSSLFWSLFGMGESNAYYLTGLDHKFVSALGFILVGCFHVVFIILLINMLIAMMTTSYDTIQEGREREWKYARTFLYMDYITSDQVVPAPLNLISLFTDVVFRILYKICRRKHERQSIDEMTIRVADAKYQDVISKLKKRYERKFLLCESSEDQTDSTDIHRPRSGDEDDRDSWRHVRTRKAQTYLQLSRSASPTHDGDSIV